MPLTDQFEREGNWLFQRRSFLPLALLVPVLLALRQFDYLAGEHRWQEVWAACCLLISFSGLAIRASVVGYAPRRTSGRNTWSGQIADELNTTGLYSLVRNPLYLGNFIIWLGITLFFLIWWLTLIVCLVYWLYYERIIIAEERFLSRKFGATYTDWAKKTPAFLPKLRGWKQPTLPFSVRNVLRREYTGFFGIVAAFFGLEIVEHLAVEHEFYFEPHWLVLFAVGAILFFVLRTLKRSTDYLNSPGR